MPSLAFRITGQYKPTNDAAVRASLRDAFAPGSIEDGVECPDTHRIVSIVGTLADTQTMVGNGAFAIRGRFSARGDVGGCETNKALRMYLAETAQESVGGYRALVGRPTVVLAAMPSSVRNPARKRKAAKRRNPAKRTKRNAIASAVYARLGHAGVFHRTMTGVHSIYDPRGKKAGENLVPIGQGPTWDAAFADMVARLDAPRRNPSKPSRPDRDEEAIRKWAPGALKRLAREKAVADEGRRRSLTPGTAEYQRYNAILSNQPQWETLEGQWILRVPGQPIAALPNTGKKSAAKFTVFDVKTRQELAFLRKDEVSGWLTLRAIG